MGDQNLRGLLIAARKLDSQARINPIWPTAAAA